MFLKWTLRLKITFKFVLRVIFGRSNSLKVRLIKYQTRQRKNPDDKATQTFQQLAD